MRSSAKSSNTHVDICISNHSLDDSKLNTKNTKLSELVSDMRTVVKVIASITLSDDEDDTADYMSSFKNFSAVANRIRKHNLSDDIVSDESTFNSNPVKAWLGIMSIAMIALYAAHTSEMSCEIINDENDNENGIVGIYYSINLNLELLGWEQHTISILIPVNTNLIRMTLVIDHEIQLFC